MLSSLNKLANYTELNIVSGDNKLKNIRNLLNWQASISNLIESFCNRKFIIQSRTERFDTLNGQSSYFPQGLPVLSVTSIKADSLGRYDSTSDYALNAQDFRIGIDNFSIVLNYPLYPALGGCQITYLGGIAYHAVKSTFNVSDIVGNPTSGWYVLGSNSYAIGIVRDWSSPTIAIENIVGVFQVDDDLQFATTEKALFEQDGFMSGVTCTISEILTQSLSELAPDLERACEIETRYMAKHQFDFENVSTMDDQTTRRQGTVYQTPYVFQPETLAILGRYRRPLL